MKVKNYAVFIFAMIMVSQTVLIFEWGEPYPSIALPRVAGTISQKDTIEASQEVFVVEDGARKHQVVSPSRLFLDALPNIRKSISSYLKRHIQYREGSYLSQRTKTKVRNWLVKRIKQTGISEVRRVYGASIETRHPICAGCDHSGVQRDTSSLTLLFRREQ